jgi:outer membrane protein assembly factor BamB
MRFLLAALTAATLLAKDQPQWGQAWSRNMISAETNLPAEFDLKSGKNVVWSARIGTESQGSPIIADGRVYIGTNNGEPRSPKHKGDRGVLMCFDEKTGSFLWQLVVPKRAEDPYLDWPNSGIASEATVDSGKVYIVSNRGEVLCLDPQGLLNGNDGPYQDESAHQTPVGEPLIPTDSTDADILWLFNMVTEAGIYTHDGAHSSILVDGDYLYVNTGTGVDNTHRKIRTPEAPSLIVLDKKTGRLLAREREGIAPNIFHATWSAPSMYVQNGQKVILFAGGNGILYAFEALTQKPEDGVATLKKMWQYDPDPEGPKDNVHRFTTNRREGPATMYGMPVVADQQILIAGGGDLWWGKNEAWLKCLNLQDQSLVWTYPLERHTMSTAAVTPDLVFVSDCGKLLHCIDRKSGQRLWTHELRAEIWASPLVADGKVYLGSRRGDFHVLAATREKRLLQSAEFGAPISATVTAANGRIYISSMTHLFSLGK